MMDYLQGVTFVAIGIALLIMDNRIANLSKKVNHLLLSVRQMQEREKMR